MPANAHPASPARAIVSNMRRRTDHFDGRRFFNPNGANGQPFWVVPRLLLTPRTRWPSELPVEPRRPPNPGPGEAMVTFVGHATFLLQVAGTNVLIDPVYSRRASPVSFAGPRRARAPGVRFEDLPAISLVLLSHNHYDHCDLGTLQLLERRFQPRVVTPRGNGRLLRSAGIRQVEEIDWWETSSTAPLPVTVTPAQHFSAEVHWIGTGRCGAAFSLRSAGTASSTPEIPATAPISARSRRGWADRSRTPPHRCL
jgi:hypothetical protein